MSEKDKVRIGFVGCGGIANWHMGHLEKMDDVDVVAACDIIPERAQKMAERAGGAQVYDNHHEFYENAGELDAVFICIPPYAHTDTETMAIERDLPLFVEKPMTLDIELAKQVAAAISDKGLISAVGFQDRYLDVMEEAKPYLAKKEIGLVYGGWMGGVPGVPWWRKKEESGGQIVEQTIHLYDELRWLVGEVDSVYAAGAAGIVELEGYDVEDYSAVTMKFKNGVIGTIFSACYLKGIGAPSGLTFICSDARVEYDLRSAVRIIEKNQTREVRQPGDHGMTSDRTFIEAVKTGDGSKIRSPYPDALKSLAVTLAANKSLETGEAVKMDEFLK